jgi:hypothetical protein
VTDGARTIHRSLIEEAQKLIIDSTYTGRGHHVAGARWLVIHQWLGIPASILTTVLAGSAALSALLKWNAYFTAALALIATIASAANAFLQPSEKADAHTRKGNQSMEIRDAARFFKDVDLLSGQSDELLAAKFRKLRASYHAMNDVAPLQIPRWAYTIAQKNIADGESDYANDHLWQEMES